MVDAVVAHLDDADFEARFARATQRQGDQVRRGAIEHPPTPRSDKKPQPPPPQPAAVMPSLTGPEALSPARPPEATPPVTAPVVPSLQEPESAASSPGAVAPNEAAVSPSPAVVRVPMGGNALYAVLALVMGPLGRTLTSAERWLAVAISNHVNRRTGEAFPSLHLLAEETGLHRATVIRMLNRPPGAVRPVTLCCGDRAIFDRERRGRLYYYTLASWWQEQSDAQVAQGDQSHGATSRTVRSVADQAGTSRTVRRDRSHGATLTTKEQPKNKKQRASKLDQAKADTEALEVAEAYRLALGRSQVTLAALQAARRALDAGATVAELLTLCRAVASVRAGDVSAKDGTLLAWAVGKDVLDATFLFRPDKLEKLILEARSVLRAPAVVAPPPDYSSRPLDEVPFHLRGAEARRRGIDPGSLVPTEEGAT